MVENLISSIIILVKCPEGGKVKVRLNASIDEDLIVELYRNFVLDLLSMLSSSSKPFVVGYHPPDALDWFRKWLGNSYNYLPQRGDDLGERLNNIFIDVFCRGVRGTIAMSSDVPDLPERILNEASASLKSHDAVIGPSPDGGYYLIGFRRDTFLPEAFEEITWGTEAVFKQTIDKFFEQNIDFKVLESWPDVDVYEDLVDLFERNGKTSFYSSRTMEFLRQHLEIFGR